MKKLLVAPAALLAAGLFLMPDDASARPWGGFHGGGVRVGAFHGGFRPAFHGGFRGAAFHGGFRPGFGAYRTGFYRPWGGWGYYRRPYWGGYGAALATSAIVGAGLAAATAPYYDDYYGYGDVGYGACYQVPTWAWTGWGYQRVLVTRC